MPVSLDYPVNSRSDCPTSNSIEFDRSQEINCVVYILINIFQKKKLENIHQDKQEKINNVLVNYTDRNLPFKIHLPRLRITNR